MRSPSSQHGVSAIVATLLLIIVVVVAAASFALLLFGFQSQSQKQQNQIQNEQDEDLKVGYLQLFPVANPSNFFDPITFANITVLNYNTQPSAVTAIEMNAFYFKFNQTVIPAQESHTFPLSNLTLMRTSPISIEILTAAENVFSFLITPPTANFNIQSLGPSEYLLNASGSFSPDTTIVSYLWNAKGLGTDEQTGDVLNSALSGQSVQYFPTTASSQVNLTVVDFYGLLSVESQTFSTLLQNTPATSVTTTAVITSVTTTTTVTGSSTGCTGSSECASNPLWNANSQKVANYVIQYGWDPYIQLIHDVNEPGCVDYVGGYPCDNTFWTTSDNIPTCWTLGSFGFQTQQEECEAKVISLGGVGIPPVPCTYPCTNNGERYEAFAGYPIITGNPGDSHLLLLPPNGQNNFPCPNVPPACTGHYYGIFPAGDQYQGLPYAIQADVWSGQGAGTPQTGIAVDIEAPQAINAWLRGDMSTFLKLENDLEGRMNSSGYIGAGSTWQLGQVIFVMEVGGRGNTTDFQNMENMLWSLQNPAGWLPNSYTGAGQPGTGHDPENQDAGLLPFCYVCIVNIQSNFGEYTYASPPVG